MEPIRTFIDVQGDTITVPVPEEYRNHRVRVTVEPVTESGEEVNVIPIPISGVQILSQPKGPVDLARFQGILKGKAGEDLEAHYKQIHDEWDRNF